jgi:uncharacterized membrane protein
MPIVLHELRDGSAAIEVARRLKRRSAYGASYIVLAQPADQVAIVEYVPRSDPMRSASQH